MPRKYDFDLRWQFHNDLLKAYRKVAPTCWQQQQAWRRVCESPAPRFYISGHALEEVIRRILYDGMGFLQSMGGNRRRMYEELWVRFSKMVTERPYCNMDMRSVCCILVAQPAPEFYCSPETVRSVFSRMRRKMLSRHVADSHRKPSGVAAGAVAADGAVSGGGTLSAGAVSRSGVSCAGAVGSVSGGAVSGGASAVRGAVGAASAGAQTGCSSSGSAVAVSAGSVGGSSAQKDLARGIVGVNAKGVVVLERGGCASVAEVTGDEGLSMVSARRSAFRGGTGLPAGGSSVGAPCGGVGDGVSGESIPGGDGVPGSASAGADEVYAGDGAAAACGDGVGTVGASLGTGGVSAVGAALGDYGDEAEAYVDAAYSDALRLGVEGMHGVDADGGELDVSMS